MLERYLRMHSECNLRISPTGLASELKIELRNPYISRPLDFRENLKCMPTSILATLP